MSEGERKLLMPADIDTARAVDIVELVRRAGITLRKEGRDLIGLCPFHRDRTPSLRVSPHWNNFRCWACGEHGDSITFIRKVEHLSFVDAVRRLIGEAAADRTRLRVVVRNEKPRDPVASPKVLSARAIWRSALSARGTLVELYFAARSLPTPVPPTIRFLPRYAWRRNFENIVPAMIVAVQAIDGRVVGIEATALLDDGTGKRFGKFSRDKVGELFTGAVRFAAPSDVLGLSEGCESALSAQHMTGLPTWASLGTARMHSVTIPNFVKELIVFADDDAPGRMAAERTCNAHPNIRTVIRFPPVVGGDWNDALRCAL